ALADQHDVVIWDAVRQPWQCRYAVSADTAWAECTSDTLWPARVDTMARGADFFARRASLSGYGGYCVCMGGRRIIHRNWLSWEVHSFDMGGNRVRQAVYGAVDRYDMAEWVSEALAYPDCAGTPWPAYADWCPGDFDEDYTTTAADSAKLRRHIGHSL